MHTSNPLCYKDLATLAPGPLISTSFCLLDRYYLGTVSSHFHLEAANPDNTEDLPNLRYVFRYIYEFDLYCCDFADLLSVPASQLLLEL